MRVLRVQYRVEMRLNQIETGKVEGERKRAYWSDFDRPHPFEDDDWCWIRKKKKNYSIGK